MGTWTDHALRITDHTANGSRVTNQESRITDRPARIYQAVLQLLCLGVPGFDGGL